MHKHIIIYWVIYDILNCTTRLGVANFIAASATLWMRYTRNNGLKWMCTFIKVRHSLTTTTSTKKQFQPHIHRIAFRFSGKLWKFKLWKLRYLESNRQNTQRSCIIYDDFIVSRGLQSVRYLKVIIHDNRIRGSVSHFLSKQWYFLDVNSFVTSSNNINEGFVCILLALYGILARYH